MAKQSKEKDKNEASLQAIESAAIKALKLRGHAEFESEPHDTAIMIKSVVEGLFAQQLKTSILLASAQYSVNVPEIEFYKNRLKVKCEINMHKPTKMKFIFSYTLKNSVRPGIVELESMDTPKVILSGNKIMKSIARKALDHFHVAQTAKDILSNLNQELLTVLICNHGDETTVKKLGIIIQQNSLKIILE